MTENKDGSAQMVNVSAVTPEEREKQLALETYLWLDERLGDRDEKDFFTLELAAKIAVG